MRCARKIAESGFYHVVTKGEADGILFLDNSDRSAYLDLLKEALDQNDILLHAYCLMSNHVHLLLEDTHANLSAAMKQLNERYADRFKKKAGRTGHVFKNRFWSEAVENDAYFLCAMRYIHANPAVAGICKASAYKWSSAQDYLGREGITNTSRILDLVGGKKGFIAFSQKQPYPALSFPKSRMKKHLESEEVKRIVRNVAGDPNELARLPHNERLNKIGDLHACGLSAGQIASATNLSYNIVQGAVKSRGKIKGQSPN